jgi:hypothetical protein
MLNYSEFQHVKYLNETEVNHGVRIRTYNLWLKYYVKLVRNPHYMRDSSL